MNNKKTRLLGEKPIRYIFRASKMSNGVRIYAKDYGKKAFIIPIYK